MPAKITLSPHEQQLVADSGLILTKRIIIEKVVHLFAAAAENMQKAVAGHPGLLPESAAASTPRITRGENYLQLPYVVLDYPRCFEKDNILVFRSMFWWGNFFSCTMHLSGEYKALYKDVLQMNSALIRSRGYFMGIHADPWQHHFEKDNYEAASAMSLPGIHKRIGGHPFIKIALQFPLQRWNEMPFLLEKTVMEMMLLLRA